MDPGSDRGRGPASRTDGAAGSRAASGLIPVAISQHNAEAAGFRDGRQFLDWTRAHPELVARAGKLRIVPVDVLLSALRSEQARPEPADEVDALLGSVGRRRR